MDNFIVSARKYRPITFESVVGQVHITNTLKNAIKNNQLAQAFLFCGPRGVGKTTCARILAKTINCLQLTKNTEACGTCESCLSFQNGNSYNFHELDAASNNSVDDIRNLIDQVRIPPQGGKFKVYIIDEVHMLSSNAFNAFLKTLEEPPSYAIFILATTEKHKILPTILSRCQIFDFNRIKVEDMAMHLESIAINEHISFDRDGIHLIAQKADGGLRDALSMFDQIASFSNKNISYSAVISNLNLLDHDYYFRITDFVLEQDLPNSLLLFNEILEHGFESLTFAAGFCIHIRNLLICKDSATIELLEVSESIKSKYLKQSAKATVSFLISALNVANTSEINYKQSKNPRLQIELMLIKLCHLESVLNINQPKTQVEVKKKPEKLDTPTIVQPTIHKKSSFEAVESVIKEVGKSDETKLNNVNGNLSIGLSKDLLIPDLKSLSTPIKTINNETIEIINGNETKLFDYAELLSLWKKYAIELKSKNKIALAVLMERFNPELKEDFKLELILENKLQEDELKNGKIELLNYLRNSLENFQITIETTVSNIVVKGRPYTAQEKFQYFVEKNPLVENFKNEFNLTIL